MALNAINVNKIIQKDYIELSEEGNRFSLFQNMAYLLLIPKQLRTKSNNQYNQSLKYLKRNFVKNGISNKYLTLKNKFVIFGLILCPEIVIKVFQRKHRL